MLHHPLQPPLCAIHGGPDAPSDELMPQVTTAHLEQGGIPIEKGFFFCSMLLG